MQVVELADEMQSISEQLRKDGHRIALVPTMGCLHAGHASLIEAAQGTGWQHPSHTFSHYKMSNHVAREGCQVGWRKVESPRTVVVVSIFTNPTQFNSLTDYLNYDKNLEADLACCERLKVDYVFAPDCEQMYPSTNQMHAPIDRQQISSSICTVKPPNNPLSKDLEGSSRPGHFKGMLTVVCKLFNITAPHVAYFGEKDYQQLVLVRQMVRDLNMRVDICPVNTVRDHDLLPLSSRNVRLNRLERKLAPIMYRILLDANRSLLQLQESYKSAQMTTVKPNLDVLLFASTLLTCATNLSREEQLLFHVDYLELRCANELRKVTYQSDLDLFDCEAGCVRGSLVHASSSKRVVLKGRLLTSVIVGNVRLLDNIEVQLNT